MHTGYRLLAGVYILAFSGRVDLLFSQEFSGSDKEPSFNQQPRSNEEPPPVPPGFREQTRKNAAAPCLEPPPLPSLKDYNGPLKKTVGVFARALERKSVREPHYKPGVTLCSLQLDDKFLLFVEDSIDPITFLSAGFDAGIDQAEDRDSHFGQGAKGYAKRFGADLADQVSLRFFRDFAYPSIFSEDPRYYRLGNGPVGKRLLHAAGHLLIAYRPDGTRMFNYSEWLGTGSTVALSNLYHPGQDRGAGGMARSMGYQFAWDVGFDALREFWPEIARKLKLPFRGVAKQGNAPAKPSPD